MTKYETIYILRPELSDDLIQSFLLRMRELIESQQGKPVSINEWGIRKLAYTIKYRGERFQRGYYILFTYLGNGKIVNELERVSKLTDEVIRAQTVKLEEDVDPASVTEMTLTREAAPEPEAEDFEEEKQVVESGPEDTKQEDESAPEDEIKEDEEQDNTGEEE
jgi:small subunit ribosomal protein S6